jgi:sterol desaturase/sphingolipid hydroxylase (fatty acid hydroxylase superfamily)
MDELAGIYLYLYPIVLVSALVEGFVLMRGSRGFNWKSWACSLGDLIGRKIASFFPYTLAGPILALAWEHRLFTLKLDSVANVALLFIGLEFFYYWYHRTSHTVRWFWNSHSVHHSPNELTLAAAYRLGWLGKFSGTTIFFAPLVLLGFQPKIVMTALLLNLLYQFWLHADWIPKLGWLEHVLNTPSSHRVHHARNLEYLDANFGGVLIVFDRLFGTYIEERETVPCDFGLVSRMTSYNPIYVNFSPWIGLAKDLASARSLREVWFYLFGPPGWRPDGEALTTSALRARAHLAMT